MVPLDSKFGLAWRDWRVLTEMTAGPGQVAYAQAADAIADLLDDPATDRQWSRPCRTGFTGLYAWWLIDRDHFAPRIKTEADALLALQNRRRRLARAGRQARPGARSTPPGS